MDFDVRRTVDSASHSMLTQRAVRPGLAAGLFYLFDDAHSSGQGVVANNDSHAPQVAARAVIIPSVIESTSIHHED